MVVQGANDPHVIQVESDAVVAAVNQNGVLVEHLLFPDEGHGLRKKVKEIEANRRRFQFLDQHLLGKP